MASSATSDETNPSASSGADVDDEEEEDQCRICRCPATVVKPLHYPCACRGSIKFVHQLCLLRWMLHSGTLVCEVCRHTFSFKLMYAENAPTKLSLGEQLSWVAAKTWTGLQFLTRLAIVLFVWLVMVPLVTAQIWYMVFIRSFRELGECHWLLDCRTILYKIVCAQAFIPILLGAPWLISLVLIEGSESFLENIGMRGVGINLAKHAFQVQLGISILLVTGVSVPFSCGRIVLNLMRNSKHGFIGHVSDWTTLAVGYLSIIGPAAIVLGVHVIPRYFKSMHLWNIVKTLSVCMSFVLRLIKQGFVIMIVLGVFPWVCGWWLDICTMSMVQLQLERKDLTVLLNFPPLRMLVWWPCGIYSLVVVRKFLLVVSEELQEGLLNFLQIPTDINLNWIREFTAASLHETLYRVLQYAAVFMIVTVVLAFLPSKLVMYTIPSFFPLNFIFVCSLLKINWDTLGRLLRSHYVTCRYNPHSAFKFLLRHWLSFVGGALGLDDFLLPKNEDSNAPTSRLNIMKECQDHQVNFRLLLKFAALLVLGTATLVLLTVMMVVPISLGRAAFSLILWIPTFSSMGRNDKINFLVGWILILEGILVVRSLINFVGTGRLLSDLQLAAKCCIIRLKSFVLISISVLIFPLLVGLLADFTIVVPFYVSFGERMDERPILYFNYIWVLGSGILGECIRVVMLDERGTDFGDWPAKLARAKADGFSHLRALWLLHEILCPILSFLLNWLCIPYMFAKGVFPLFGYSMRANSSVYHYAWLGYLVLLILWLIFKQICIWLSGLHNRIRDDRYLIGPTLCNYQD
ncbi:hypothetical protein LUZ63_003122 [Rhynchospora breviuscula]|uniref:RING-CH-type domain-containing protein n=1 Tax=Rhynchospora breviuscula TaxID=2022672 RepID=A0A9Q0D023_9POAL|nr:hypothetical protein LUZ63_003122 [Rhynchospora breviuscula]